MKRGLLGAAAFAAGVLGADISASALVAGSAGLAALAQEATGTSPDLAGSSAAPGGFGNGGAGFGTAAGGSTAGPDEASGAGSGGADSGTEAGASDGAAGATEADGAEQGKAKDDAEAGTAQKTLEAAPEALATTTGTDTQPVETVETSAKASVPNVSGTGNLTSAIPLDLPSFRGLEPSLALTYDSSRKTKTGATYQGWLGYAWGLDGFDVIERASVGYGIPAFDAADVFLLNGLELVPCAAGVVSPSCATGGTHATENESYRRIAFDAAANQWAVTARDGTVSTFRSVAAVSGATPVAGTPAYDLGQNYRWLLTSVTDTNGNSVAYGYSCPDSPVCYPETVSYNGTEIRFYRETRPDYILMANGHDISQTTQRIKTIAVSVGGALRDAYGLTYDQAPMSNTSRLTRVDRFGRQATVAADGTISGGTQKLVQQMQYQDLNASYTGKSVSNLIPRRPSGLPQSRTVADLDADGRDELFGPRAYITMKETPSETTIITESRFMDLSTFDKFGTMSGRTYSLGSQSAGAQTDISIYNYVGSFVPGKKTKDFAIVRENTWQGETSTESSYTYHSLLKIIAQTDPALNVTVASGALPPPLAAASAALPSSWRDDRDDRPKPRFVADMDGDGTDELLVTNQPNGAYYKVGDSLKGTADLRGNGRQTALFWSSDKTIRKAIRTNGAWSREIVATAVPAGAATLTDINGDGATDILINKYSSPRIYLSTGRSYWQLPINLAIINDGYSIFPSDFDNDGKAELVEKRNYIDTAFGPIRVFGLMFRSAGHSAVHFAPLNRTGSTLIGDFNGDGLPDMFRSDTSFIVSNPGPGNPNLLRSVTTGSGAAISAEYTPSSRWTNDYLPNLVHAVTKLTVSDGRGGAAAVTDYAYGGGQIRSQGTAVPGLPHGGGDEARGRRRDRPAGGGDDLPAGPGELRAGRAADREGRRGRGAARHHGDLPGQCGGQALLGAEHRDRHDADREHCAQPEDRAGVRRLQQRHPAQGPWPHRCCRRRAVDGTLLRPQHGGLHRVLAAGRAGQGRLRSGVAVCWLELQLLRRQPQRQRRTADEGQSDLAIGRRRPDLDTGAIGQPTLFLRQLRQQGRGGRRGGQPHRMGL
ncbi:FG-GAP-like repeat-containing protein [Aminobacter sp. BE322]|uniref:FG-GAP-like repeat-containing protein n=1 Tax=unclassified Aminobacter TaxID=2644704 RepID=UPI003D1B0CCB